MQAANIDRDKEFSAITALYREVIAKVCYLYSSETAPFDDLFQEVLINIWQGLDSYRGEAKLSTWIYRAAINTCISWHRRNSRYGGATTRRLDGSGIDLIDADAGHKLEEYRELHRLVGLLSPLDKAFITLWLDEKTYDEIAVIMGISKNNVAVKIHRIKEKLSKLAKEEC